MNITFLQTVPIFIPYDSNAKISPEGAEALAGIIFFLLILGIISFIITTIIESKEQGKFRFMKVDDIMDYPILGFFILVLLIIVSVFILLIVGSLLGPFVVKILN